MGPPADPEAVARAICLRLLEARPRTRAELAAAMHRRAVPAEVAERLLVRFGEVGLVDDAALASAWVQSRSTGRALAGRALAGELTRRGVARELVTAAVATLDPAAELSAARELVARRLSRTAGLPVAVRTRRLAAVLARKGYAGSLAMQVVREALAAEAPDPGVDPDDRDGTGIGWLPD